MNRSAQADLALALLLEAQRARPELRLLVASATLDGGRLAALMNDCPVTAFAAGIEVSPQSASELSSTPHRVFLDPAEINGHTCLSS